MAAKDHLQPQQFGRMSLEELGWMESSDGEFSTVGAVAGRLDRHKSTKYFMANPDELEKNPVKLSREGNDLYFDDGHHRFRAAEKLGKKDLPVEITHRW